MPDIAYLISLWIIIELDRSIYTNRFCVNQLIALFALLQYRMVSIGWSGAPLRIPIPIEKSTEWRRCLLLLFWRHTKYQLKTCNC